MSKYPVVLFFRYDKYTDADDIVKDPKIDCDVHIINKVKDIEKLYSTDYHVLVTYGPQEQEYIRDVNSIICQRLRRRWIHHAKKIDPAQFSRGVNYCYIENVIADRKTTRPLFSAFTTCFNSFDKINRPYKTLKQQSEKDWEWVIVDDSTDESHWLYLKNKFKDEPKIRIYKRARNSGSIGNVKNEAIALCRGSYVLELDHDDEILPDLFKDAVDGFTKYPTVDFIYMDFINLYETGANFSYSDFICKGFGGYYYQFYPPTKTCVKVYVTPQINNITASYLFCMPNHPRIWRREALQNIGSYSEFLPICDDQEILLRTILNLKILKIPKLAYVQYFNEVGSNFSLIRNAEINRIGPKHLTPQFKAKFPALMNNLKQAGAYEEPKYDQFPSPIWSRDNFIPQYINEIYNPDYDKQIAIIGQPALQIHLEEIQKEAKNLRTDFILLANSGKPEEVFELLKVNGLQRAKFYILKDVSTDNLIKYFHYIYRSTKLYTIYEVKAEGAKQ